MIRVVAFDIGKVLLDFDYRIFARRMAPRTRLDVPALDAFLNQSPLLAEYESGQLTTPEFFAVVQKETGFDGVEADFGAHFENIFTPIDEVIAMHATLAADGLRTYTFSNTNELAVRHISAAYDFWPRFTGHVLSYEAKSLKPESGIYEVLEQTSGCSGGEIAYLDDRPENIEAGRARGWRVIHHRTPAETRAALEALAVLS
jgi:putative hydrolase of the HAD superfamily